MGRATIILAALATLAASAAAAQDEVPAFEDRRLEALTSPELQTYESEQEFARYVRETNRIYRKRHPRRSRYRSGAERDVGIPEIVIAQADIDCDKSPDDEACLEEQTIVVTGSRISSAPTITNVQVAGVDEGDIVKQIGEYLLVLQDGRIFAIYYPSMRLTDRMDAYRRDGDGDPIGADWYDEMLVQGDQIIVTAYSYEDEASEISVFRLDQASGRIERRGVFLITSDDYYDVSNYATRIIGDRLIIHTPYEIEQVARSSSRPVIRRWLPGETRDEAIRAGRQLFGAREIYRPVFAVEEPVVHTISVCPLGDVVRRGLECRTTGFVGSDIGEMFVTPENIYFWMTALSYGEVEEYECPEIDGRPHSSQIEPAAVMRFPVEGGEAAVMSARGWHFDQFSLDEHEDRFRALVSWRRHYCQIADVDRELEQVALIDEPRSAFGPRYRNPPERRFVELPGPGAPTISNRFAGNWLVYGGRQYDSGNPFYGDYYVDDEAEEAILQPSAIAVPLGDPSASVRIGQPHNVIRIERIGDDMVINGYKDRGGLSLTYLDLGETARIASTVRIDNRFESEGRSHAFNATRGTDGSGILAVPTRTTSRKLRPLLVVVG